MRSRFRLVGGLVLVAVAAVASVLALPDLPERTAIHWGPGGSPDDFASPAFAAAFVPALMVVVLALFEGLPRVDPLKENFEEFAGVYDALVLATLGFLAGVHGLVLAFNLGYGVPMDVAVAVGVGGLYVVLGAVLHRVQRNWAVGVRTPWTLSDDVVWERTHDRAGSAFVVAGVASVAAALAVPEYATLVVVASAVVVAVAVSAYSYVLYRRRHPEGERTSP
ncbi:DUF1648 domain-containing protein [Halorubellus sp. JP-L1]|uniref:SdpI family protein n=1 Tax=Halorubellus sp. JP-L1 TaxID=2715753 RepID=UPI00140AE6F5|nr:SdpI family protein [Halorubellus sp. JP-L1]NHN40999.1 DUF1648 domain-containing protein [Halorubellus sp. JP-L1]